jgi:hypothetical protein
MTEYEPDDRAMIIAAARALCEQVIDEARREITGCAYQMAQQLLDKIRKVERRERR